MCKVPVSYAMPRSQQHHCILCFALLLTICFTNAAPLNDDFAKRALLSGPTLGFWGSFDGATVEPGEPDQSFPAGTIWWSWTAPQHGLVLITPPTNVTATVQIFTGTAFSNLTLVSQGSSAFSFTVVEGTTYSIRLRSDQWVQSASFFTSLTLLPRPPNYQLTKPILLAGTNVFVETTADAAPSDPENPWVQPYTLWWEWTSPGIGYVSIDTTLSSHSANLFAYLYSGNGLITFGGLLSFQTSISGLVSPGTKLLISTTGGDTRGTNKIVLRIRMPELLFRPANDFFTNALLLTGTNLALTGTLANADKEIGEPDHGDSADYLTVWYRWLAPERGNVTLSVSSPTQPRFAAYRGTSLTNLVPLAIVPSGVRWIPVALGDEVVFAVADFFATPFQLNLRHWPSPANDDFSAAEPLILGSQNNLDTRGATTEIGETNHANAFARFSLWYNWTPSASGQVTLFASSTNTDPVLAVYTGASTSNLTLVVATNDYRPLSSDSQVSFNAVNGQAYRIVVATRSAGGDVSLKFSTGAPPSLALNVTPSNTTNAAGSNYTFELFPADPEGDFLGTMLNWGTNSYPVTGPPYQITLSNLAPGSYTMFASVQDSDGYGAATPATTFFVSSTNDLATARLFISSGEIRFMSLAGSTQQAGEPFAASWWSWTPSSDGIYLVTGDFSRAVIYEVSGMNFMFTAGRTNSNGARIAFIGKAGQEYAFAIGNALSGPPTRLLITNAAANDFFTNPIVLAGNSGVISAPIATATMQLGEPNHGGLSMESSSWWSWTAMATGTFVLETTSPVTTRAVTYTGTSISNLQSIGSRVAPSGLPQQWTAQVSPGVTYAIVIASQGNHTLGNLGTNVTTRYGYFPKPSNDNFTNAIVLSGEIANASGYNFGATLESGDPPRVASVWYNWTAPRTGTAHLFSTGRYPEIVVYTGASVGALTGISTEMTHGADREFSFPMNAGTTYRIAVGGPQQEFNFTLVGAAPVNDAFTNRIVLSGTNPTFSGDLLTASAEAGELYNPPVKSLWWTWTPTETGIVTIAPASPYAANTFVFTGTNLNQLTPVPNLAAGSYTFLAVAGTSYQIALAGTTAFYSLLVNASILPNEIPQVTILSPTNGQRFAVGEPIPVTIHATDASGAITRINSGYFDAAFSAPDVTWTYTLTNLPAGMNTVLASATDNYGVIQNAGPVTIRITSANDDFEASAPILPGESTVFGSNVGATSQVGEPTHANEVGGASVWWFWVAPTSGRWTVDTRNSDLDTLLAVYSGNALSNVSLIGSNDNRRAGDTASAVTFTAVAGVTYRVAVDTADGRTGEIELHFTRSPINDDFTDAFALAAEFIIGGVTLGATAQPGEPPHAGVVATHSTWWSWIAPDSTNYFASTLGSDFDTTLGVYTGTNVANLSFVAGNDDDNSYFTSRVLFNTTAGQKYWFAIDGYAENNGHAQLVLGKVDAPFLSSVLRGNELQLTVIGQPGEVFEIEQSTNLITWTSIHTQMTHNGWIELQRSMTNAPYLFYRARKP